LAPVLQGLGASFKSCFGRQPRRERAHLAAYQHRR